MNPLKVLKESIPALQLVFEKILYELEEINSSNKEILEVLKKNEPQDKSDTSELQAENKDTD